MTGLESGIHTSLAKRHPLRSAVVGVLVHNEDPTIATCLDAILGERDGREKVRSVLVVASGCTDETEEIVRRVARKDSRVRLISEPQRSGKAAAINLLLRETSNPIVVVVGGDVVFAPGSLVKLLEPFRDPSVGMTGARPIPTNARVGVIGNAVNLLWDMHHELSLRQPKLGEAVAFRRVLRSIDPGTLVDEATMEHAILAQGLQLRYVPDAVVRNHGPESLREFLAQRVRIYHGHLALASTTGYRVSSMGGLAVASVAWRLWRRGQSPYHILVTMTLEVLARARARFERLSGGHPNDGIWQQVASSKRVVAKGHVLRKHHELLQKLVLRPVLSARSRSVLGGREMISNVRRLIRADDRIRSNRENLTITFPGDTNSARALTARLFAQIPDLIDTMASPMGSAPQPPAALKGNGREELTSNSPAHHVAR